MLLNDLTVDLAAFERRTGWAIKPVGACRGEMCVPLRSETPDDARVLSERLAMPLVEGRRGGVWALGPSALTSRALDTAEAPDFTLPDHRGDPFTVSSLRGQKVFLLAWASW